MQSSPADDWGQVGAVIGLACLVGVLIAQYLPVRRGKAKGAREGSEARSIGPQKARLRGWADISAGSRAMIPRGRVRLWSGQLPYPNVICTARLTIAQWRG
jgi:hypothetical protein